ncbi:hypothetical protein CEK26_011484 [Fusarium fujikuroi]|nr:hypothetical protein CEK27_011503 [Fusarium fujikuroi]QGI84758.1 hypothetical protein CEK25_011487 [Fusarium fujikuroi]QGI98415.1 hypothetical protein CEK26_011484 [Fusarium fujikuroi]
MSIEPQTISTLGTTAGLSVGNECSCAPLFASSSKSGYSQLDLPQPTYENPPAESVKIYVTTNGEAKAGTDIDASVQEFSSLINQPTWSDPHSEWPHIEKLIRACIKCHDRKPSYRVESSFGGFLSTAATAAQGLKLQIKCSMGFVLQTIASILIVASQKHALMSKLLRNTFSVCTL